MKTVILKESAAWRFLATKIIAQGGLTPTLFFPKGTGLCLEVQHLGDKISSAVRCRMNLRIDQEVESFNATRPSRKSAYLCREGRADVRLDLVKLFALIARDEERATLKQERKDAAAFAKLADRVLEIDLSEEEDDGYVPRSNSVAEGAEEGAWEAGAGGRGFDANDSDSKPW